MQSYFVWSGGHTQAYEYYCLKKKTLCLSVVNSVGQSLLLESLSKDLFL